MQLINRNVSDFVEIPKKKPFEINVLNEHEVKALLSCCESGYLYMAVLLAVALGLRRGEVLALKWGDIDFDYKVVNVCRTQVIQNGKIVFAPTKTLKSSRSILVSDKMADKLSGYKLKQEEVKNLFGDVYGIDDLIVCRDNGSPISAYSLNKKFRSILQRYSLPIIRFHDLRHTNATLMLKNGIPAKIASERLGHSSIGITLDLYSHVINEMQKDASEVIDNILSQKIR